MIMKDPSQRTKVVIRHLPPSLLQSDFFIHIDARFSGRYNWSHFRPGKISQKQQRYSRAYIDFKRLEDVYEFAEFFGGHVFVNEKGLQHKAVVEYAPSQRTPLPHSRKDAREGTIHKDPDYLEFLKVIAQPIEHLPSAEIQLERKEAEQAGTSKETLIVTPLMEFIRQKRAAENGPPRGSLAAKKVSRRGRGTPEGKSRPSATKRASEKKKYNLKESANGASRKDKSQFVVVPMREGQQVTSSGTSEIENVCGTEGSVSGIPLIADSGKKILLLKGRGRDASNVPESMPQTKDMTSLGKSPASTVPKQNPRREAGGKLIRSILLKNENRQSQSSIATQPQHKNDHVLSNKPNAHSSDADAKRVPQDRSVQKDRHGLGEKQEKRTRNKDRLDRGVWAPLGRSNGDHTSSMSQSTLLPSDKVEVSIGVLKDGMDNGSRNMEATIPESRRNGSVVNGTNRRIGRRETTHDTNDDSSLNEGKLSKRGATGQGAHEKHVWIQKAPGS